MNIEEAQAAVGEMVMSRDGGLKLIPHVEEFHGPYRLLGVTKGGMAMLEGNARGHVPPSLIRRAPC